MARIRSIKPEFFTSEDIVSLSPFARLLYIALWCEADREGRMAWKPRTFKMRYLPADDLDINALCEELVSHDLIRLYGEGLAYIPSFAKHQHINNREAESTLPDPDASARVLHASARVKDESSRVEDAQGGREGKGKEGKGDKTSLATFVAGEAEEPDHEEEDIASIPNCPHDRLLTVYAEKLPELAQPRRSLWGDSASAKNLTSRWRWVMTAHHERGSREGQRLATTVDEGVEWFGRFFEYAAECPLLIGERGEWRADLHWLVEKKNFAKVLAGTYESREKAA